MLLAIIHAILGDFVLAGLVYLRAELIGIHAPLSGQPLQLLHVHANRAAPSAGIYASSSHIATAGAPTLTRSASLIG